MFFVKWITVGMALKGLSMMSDCMVYGTDAYRTIFDGIDTPKKKMQFVLGTATGLAATILIWPISIINIAICLVFNRSQK